jgi:hypothetical protein
MKDSRKRAKQVRQRKVARLAAYSRKNTVRNCTIPTVDTTTNNFKEIEQFGKKCIVNTDIEANGNGKKWTNENTKWYSEIKETRKKYLKEHYSGRHNDPANPKHGFKKCKQPWYKLTCGKCYNYEERKTSFGAMTTVFRIPSEMKVMNERLNPKKMTQQEYWEKLTQHKLDKWIRKNPAPIAPKVDPISPDAFAEQDQLAYKAKQSEWEKMRDAAEERFRDFVISMYDKLPLSGRFEKSDNNYVEEKVAEIKDVNGEGHRVNELNPKTSKLLKVAQKKTDEVKAKRHNLVCTNLKDHKRQKGRMILPKAA